VTGPVSVILERVCLLADSDQLILNGIDLQISPGERLCVIGESGAGKSSLLRAVAGLVRPSSGQVRLETPDGLEPDDSRSALGWVPQDPAVFAATVLDNVALGRPGVDETAVTAALRAMRLGPWLRSLPQGLRTPLSGLGGPLSLGERRRLAVARCLAGPRPRLWLLDEPTAGLDAAAAGRLVSHLGRTIGGATAIIVTHDRLAISLAHRTVELCHGRICGSAGEMAGPGLLERPETAR
jgi:ABC-type transport system involved in cytochrome bd biosynthesis fused ATPase/permease subunit